MLRNVRLKNLALIKEAEIEFTPGLDILTGETGAGKSIIISSINIALGEKANKTMIRKDCDHGLVELLFTGVSDAVLSELERNDIETEGHNVIITRKITKDLSISKVNGQNVTLQTLKQITSLLVDIHGQHDHQSLLDASRHIDIVDGFGGEELEQIKKELTEEHSAYRQLRIRYQDFDKTQDDLVHETELIRHEMNEIDAAALEEEEDAKLEEEFKRLSNIEKTTVLLTKANGLFSDENNSVTDGISSALRDISEAEKLDEGLRPLVQSLTDLESMAKDAARELSHFLSARNYDPERYAFVKERLDVINRLKIKYGNSLEKIAKYRENLQEKAAYYDNYFTQKAELERRIHDSGLKLNEISFLLSEKRKSIARDLEPMIIANLKDLNFLDCRFSIRFEKMDRITGNGFDKVEFMISTNPGEEEKPLVSVASGGELSRIMLAIKSALATKDGIATLIFDEIDTGISGKTAQMVAQKLFDLSKSHQVICISHLPQIAAMADAHYKIHKEVEEGDTISGIVRLKDEQMILEIAKLVGGAQVTPAALENARDLKGNANFFKHKLT